MKGATLTLGINIQNCKRDDTHSGNKTPRFKSDSRDTMNKPLNCE